MLRRKAEGLLGIVSERRGSLQSADSPRVAQRHRWAVCSVASEDSFDFSLE